MRNCRISGARASSAIPRPCGLELSNRRSLALTGLIVSRVSDTGRDRRGGLLQIDGC